MLVPSESLQVPQTYWNHAAETYNEVFGETLIGTLTREVVWRELDAGFKPGSRVLELNCGTGIDAIHLSRRGVSVLACDISPRMVELAKKRAAETDLRQRPEFRVLPTEQLPALESGLMFDGAFSNFCGLNCCTQDLSEVSRNMARLLKPGARVFLCMLGTFTLWEKLRFLAKGDWKNVFQTVQSSSSPAAQSGVEVRYFSHRKIVDSFAPGFTLRKFKGVGIAVPPSNMEHWAGKYPGVIRGLSNVDRMISEIPGLRSLGGAVLFEFERNARTDESEERPAAGS